MNVARLYQFDSFLLDVGGHLVFREGQRLALSPRAIELLIVLVEAQANPVGKEELLNKVWADTAVEEGSLTTHISLLRKTLGKRYIETIPKRGYRFAGSLKRITRDDYARTEIRSLAVLPLASLGRGHDEDYFAGEDQSAARCLPDLRDALQGHPEINHGDRQGAKR